jgi:hypothetical protein
VDGRFFFKRWDGIRGLASQPPSVCTAASPILMSQPPSVRTAASSFMMPIHVQVETASSADSVRPLRPRHKRVRLPGPLTIATLRPINPSWPAWVLRLISIVLVVIGMVDNSTLVYHSSRFFQIVGKLANDETPGRQLTFVYSRCTV